MSSHLIRAEVVLSGLLRYDRRSGASIFGGYDCIQYNLDYLKAMPVQLRTSHVVARMLNHHAPKYLDISPWMTRSRQ